MNFCYSLRNFLREQFPLRNSQLLAFVCLLLCAINANSQTGKLDNLVEAGHFKQIARTVDASQSKDPQTLFLLSKLKQAFGKHDEALQLAEAAVKADPNKAEYHLQLASVVSDEINDAGLFKKISIANRVHSELETALKLEPRNPDCLEGMMVYYEQAPGIAGGSKAKAHQLAAEISRIDASKGYMAQAELARTEKQTDKLEELYTNAVKADPKNFEALMALASFYVSDAQKKYDLAEKYAKQAIDVDRSRTGPYVVSAEVAAFKQSWENLEAVLSEAEQANHDDLNPFYQAGRTLLQLNEELSRAERYVRKYLSQDPEGFTPPLAAAHWRLGLILEKEGRKADAIKQLEEALRLQPDFENAKKDLKRLMG
jgi:tetratricopeptide (TPR) repeat protein